MYLSSEGYQILLRVRGKAVLKRVYNDSCKKKGHEPNKLFLEEGWRIVSEQIRIFHSVYAKWVNGERDRTGGLVKERYSRYYFDSEESYNEYVSKMERGERILGQRNNRYRVSERWVELVNWGFIRSVGWVEKYMDAGFTWD